MENAILGDQLSQSALQSAQGISHLIWVNTHAALMGGAEQYIKQTVNALKSQGVHNTLFYEMCGHVDTQYLALFDAAFPIVDLASQLRHSSAQCIYVHQLSQEAILQYCVDSHLPVVRFYHDHKLFCLREHKYTTLSKSTCAKTLGINCYQCLGFLGRDQKKNIQWRRLQPYQQAIARNHNVDACVVGSQYMADHLLAHGFEHHKVHLAPLFCDMPREPLVSYPRDEKTLLFVGQLITGKGLDVLFKALSCADSKPKLWVCGDGAQRSLYQRMVNELGIQEQVHFKGKCSSEELARYYRCCSAIVIPSRAPETFCLSGIEALSYACPVIATRVGGIAQWLKSGQTGVTVPSNDVAAMAKAIDCLFAHPQAFAVMAANGQRMVAEQFSVSAHLQRLLDIFSATDLATRRS